MKIIFAIGTGSFIGGICRYLLSQFIQTKMLSTFPFGTLGVNILGCFAIGLVFGISEKVNLPAEWRLFLVAGILGGFTTFSAFSIETISLLRDEQILYAFLYISSSVLLGLIASFIGILIIKLI